MVRWLEANGYDVSYITGVDADRRGERDPEPPGLPVGRTRRVLVGAASARTSRRRATRASPRVLQRQRDLLEDALGDRASTAPTRRIARSSATRRRTLGENDLRDKCDPIADRGPDLAGRPRFSPPADGGRPENALSGPDLHW